MYESSEITVDIRWANKNRRMGMSRIVLLNTTFLRSNRKFALLIIVIIASVITPPDVFSQVLMSIPLMILYELGIFMVYLARRKKDNLPDGEAETG